MENHQSSQIRTLTYIENEDHPVFGTLVEQILHLLNSKLIFSDIIIHQNSPLMLRQPKGLVAVTDSPITKEELEEFFEVIEPNWSERIADRAFDRRSTCTRRASAPTASPSRARSGSVAWCAAFRKSRWRSTRWACARPSRILPSSPAAWC
ncbi:hypothetical protein LP420_04690 [Massilia sp. B-10]|nr:hypothetical protein LP420_04690 [Massilia sp. B-10]